MSLNQPFETYSKPGQFISYLVAPETQIFKGSIVVLDCNGYCRPFEQGLLNPRFVGVANESVDNRKGYPGEKVVNVSKSGTFVFECCPTYIPKQHHNAFYSYAINDHQIAPITFFVDELCAHNYLKVGTIVGFEQTSTKKLGIRILINNLVF